MPRATAAAAVVMGLGQTTLLACLPLLLDRTGLALAQLTLAFAIGSALFLIGAPLWSRLSDRLGRRRVVAVALLGFAASHAVLLWQAQRGPGWNGQFATLLLGRIVYGLTVSGLVPTCQAWLADSTAPAGRLAAMSRFSACLNLGRLLGPALAAASVWLLPLGPLWLVALAAWPALLMLLPIRRTPAIAARVAAGPLPWRGLGAWLGFALLMQSGLGQVQYALGPWLSDRFALSAGVASATMGWMLTACAGLLLFLQLAVVPRCRPGRGLLAAGATALLSAGLLIALADRLPLVWLGFLALGAAAALLVPTYTALATLQVGAGGQSRVAGLLAIAHTAGFSLAAALSGALFDWRPVAPFWLTALLGAAAAVLALCVRLPARTPGNETGPMPRTSA